MNQQTRQIIARTLLAGGMLVTAGLPASAFTFERNAGHVSSWPSIGAPAFPGAPSFHQPHSKIPEHPATVTEGMSVRHGTQNAACPQFQAYGYPTVVTTIEQRSYFTCRDGYAGLYDPAQKNPLWIAEHLTKGHLSGSANRKDQGFREDQQIPSWDQAHLRDYHGSGLDRGHMAPAGDFLTSYFAMEQSFFLTNIVPQNAEHNRGVWANLEAAVREMVDRRGELYVITGPVYSTTTWMHGRVRVPDALFKVLIDHQRHEMTAFLIPNQAGQGADPGPFQVTVRDVERATGLNFNPSLPRADADKMEVGGGAWLVPKVRVKFKD